MPRVLPESTYRLKVRQVANILLLASFLIFTRPANSQNLPPQSYLNFLKHESINSYKPKSDVDPQYMASASNIFKVNYVDVPASIVKAQAIHNAPSDLDSQIFIKKNGSRFVRFFIHPESEALYRNYIDRFGFSGFYWAAATSSTRTVLAWNPADPSHPLFLKLSLDKVQDQLGRIVPGWEINRSIGISAMVAATPHDQWMKSGASIIPEVIGVTTAASDQMKGWVDENQGAVVEHGYIVRDASFIDEFKNAKLYPLFGLFTKRGELPPLIVEIWRRSGKSWPDFIDEYFFKSFIEKNAELLFKQGIYPEFHGQNVVVALDPETNEILHFYHRDVGSMKVDLQLRWLNGLPIVPLRSKNAAYEFKFAEAPQKLDRYVRDYLYNWIFRYGYGNVLKEYIPNYDRLHETVFQRLESRIMKKAKDLLPLHSEVDGLPVGQRLSRFYQENRPEKMSVTKGDFDTENTMVFLASQIQQKQYMELPWSWVGSFDFSKKNFVVTDYGIATVREVAGWGGTSTKKLILVLHASPTLTEIKTRQPMPRRSSMMCKNLFSTSVLISR